MKPTTLLVILDGWGHRHETTFNAIYHANTPTWDRLWREFPHALLECSGEHVGLPHGQMGNSEVGHITIGAGRIVRQDLNRIDHSIEDGSFARNPAIQSVTNASSTGTLHVFGLLSPGGVHSHEEHIFSMIDHALFAKREVALHAFLDGRDTPPQSAESSIERAVHLQKSNPRFTLASICGRYYAMDRDNRWERTKLAYDLFVEGISRFRALDGLQALHSAYERGEFDEFVIPTQIGSGRIVQDGDDAVFMNFRADRVRQLCRAFTDDRDESTFPRSTRPRINQLVCLSPYADDISDGGSHVNQVQIAFEPEELKDTLASVLAAAHKTQLRIAETEKYAHVTYFFSGGSEVTYDGETRLIIPSPKVATYDLQPEMSAREVTAEIVSAVRNSQFDVIVCNIANADMVGHTGDFKAAISAVECIDDCLQQLTDVILETNSCCLITADHGNVEEMVNATSEQPHTAHTTGVVPFICVGGGAHQIEPTGGLKDVAPTILALMGIEQPAEMTGRSLVY
ncbi:MAG: 2,3-bisphosphoglycerate-independent phosphoglycerate mutase [Gammaproteobacteria bacterium]|nr:2,3-bisphosphoglycerate-independent phosphoglycerate mutase [Gammaproteobacteria bacterium]